MLKKNTWFLFFIVGLLVTCNSPLSESELLAEATNLYKEALDIEKEVKPMLDELIQQRNSLSVQGRMLTDQEKAFIDQVYELESSYESWKKDHVKVPSAEQGDQDHSSKKGLSAKDMLALQKKFRDNILSIREEAKKLMP